MLIILDIVLLAIAVLHLLWARGIWWPIRQETALAHAVIGFKGVAKMPPGPASLFVAVALTIAAAWPWLLPIMPRSIFLLGLAGLTVVFLGRGIVTYAPFWRRMLCEQPFATLDKRYFGPLCIAIGIAFAILLGSAI